MRVTLGNPATVPAPPNPAYSHTAYVTQGPMLYVSGQIALDENGNVDAPGDMTRQSEVIMSLLERILAAHGAGFSDVVGIRSFLTDIDLRTEYGPSGGGTSPARRRPARRSRCPACSTRTR